MTLADAGLAPYPDDPGASAGGQIYGSTILPIRNPVYVQRKLVDRYRYLSSQLDTITKILGGNPGVLGGFDRVLSEDRFTVRIFQTVKHKIEHVRTLLLQHGITGHDLEVAVINYDLFLKLRASKIPTVFSLHGLTREQIAEKIHLTPEEYVEIRSMIDREIMVAAERMRLKATAIDKIGGAVRLETDVGPEFEHEHEHEQLEHPETTEDTEMPPEKTGLVDKVTNDPTVQLFINGLTEGVKFTTAVQIQRVIERIARKIAEKWIPKEYVGILDTRAGEVIVSLAGPLAVHAIAVHAPWLVPKAEFIAAAASYAYRGQVIRLGINHSEFLVDMAEGFAAELVELATLGEGIVNEASPAGKKTMAMAALPEHLEDDKVHDFERERVSGVRRE